MKHPLFVVDFYEEYQGKTWELHHSEKKVQILYGHAPKKECQHTKLEQHLIPELHKIISKYDITVPLESFNKPMHAKSNENN